MDHQKAPLQGQNISREFDSWKIFGKIGNNTEIRLDNYVFLIQSIQSHFPDFYSRFHSEILGRLLQYPHDLFISSTDSVNAVYKVSVTVKTIKIFLGKVSCKLLLCLFSISLKGVCFRLSSSFCLDRPCREEITKAFLTSHSVKTSGQNLFSVERLSYRTDRRADINIQTDRHNLQRYSCN